VWVRDLEASLVLRGAPRTPDLHDVVLVLLGTGMRVGEALALERADLDLYADIPCVRVDATLVEPRRDAASGEVFVVGLHRQPMTKTGAARTIALPCAAIEMSNGRSAGLMRQHDREPVLAHVGGARLWPNHVRTKLRGVVAGTSLAGLSPHTLRRTVGTLVAHSAGLDAARDALGHRDPSVTARHYVVDTGRVTDVRGTLDPIFA
jgi:integrase